MNSKFLKYLQIPLALCIFGTYAVERGLASFAKTDILPPDFSFGLQLYFYIISLAMFFGGLLLDNVSSKKCIAVGTGLGIAGLLLLPYTSIGYAILFGLCMMIIKIAPFSAPMKIFDKHESWNVSLQSASKNFGFAFFIFFLGTFLITLGFATSMYVFAFLILIAGTGSYYMMPDDKIQGWKISGLIELSKNKEFWVLMIYFFFLNALYYIALVSFIPSLVKTGYTKEIAILFLAISNLVTGFLRWPTAYIGDKYGYWKSLFTGLFGMLISVILVKYGFALSSLILFTVVSSTATPNYWAQAKKIGGPKYVSTVMGLGFVFMYLGAGILFGKWGG
jgi:hypothetical protein